jgi:hypothetical protein
MGVKLQAKYEQIGKEFGPQGRMKLALLTQISSIKAAELEDSVENMNLISSAIAEVRLAFATS